MKRIYISGPMTGLPEFNFPAFNTEADRLVAQDDTHEDGIGTLSPESYGKDTDVKYRIIHEEWETKIIQRDKGDSHV